MFATVCWRFQRKPVLESPGRHFALPVAYLSKVTHHLSRCLKKTPASAFSPVLHYHISFPCPLRLLFHFLLRYRYGKVKMACCLFIYESCSQGIHLCIFRKMSQRNFRDSVVRFMLTRPWQTHPGCQHISAPQRCGNCWVNPGRTSCSRR